MRTVIDLSPLLETTMPWADLGRRPPPARRTSVAGAGHVGRPSSRRVLWRRFVRLRLAVLGGARRRAPPGSAPGRLLCGLARTKDAATLLPGKGVERIRLGGPPAREAGAAAGASAAAASGGLSLLGLRLLGRLGFSRSSRRSYSSRLFLHIDTALAGHGDQSRYIAFGLAQPGGVLELGRWRGRKAEVESPPLWR